MATARTGRGRVADGVHRLNLLEFQCQMRTCPKPVVAMVAGYAVGGGHVRICRIDRARMRETPHV